MNILWHICKDPKSTELLTEMYQRKVTHVVQDKRLARANYSCWSGELDNDQYFRIQVLNGIVMASMSEREMTTRLECLPVVWANEMNEAVEAKTEMERVSLLLQAKVTFLPKFHQELTFNDIMAIFMWTYASPTVEVYEEYTL